VSALLAAVLDRLLPATDELAGAGALGLAGAVERDPLLETMPDALARVYARLPEAFPQLDGQAQDDALRGAERDEPAAFAILVNCAYNAYYVDPRALARIERRTGYRALAPQPAGYEIEPFDERLLVRVRAREPFWRRIEEG
jgi:hypothetical protein